MKCNIFVKGARWAGVRRTTAVAAPARRSGSGAHARASRARSRHSGQYASVSQVIDVDPLFISFVDPLIEAEIMEITEIWYYVTSPLNFLGGGGGMWRGAYS